MYKLMLIDDEENILNALGRVFSREKEWQIEVHSDVDKALERARAQCFDLFLSDFRMPKTNGVQFLTEVKLLQPNAVRLILSGYTDLEALMGAINAAEIYRFITKPWVDYDIITILKQALAARDLLLENKTLADKVRCQQQELDKHKRALEKYKKSHPELFKVNWGVDGSIIYDEK